MLGFLLNRIGTMLLTMLVISMLVFFIAEVVPIDPARNALGRYASQQAVDDLREEMGLDRPAPIRYFNWISNILRGDFGESIHFRRPVRDLVAVRVQRSLPLANVGTDTKTLLISEMMRSGGLPSFIPAMQPKAKPNGIIKAKPRPANARERCKRTATRSPTGR